MMEFTTVVSDNAQVLFENWTSDNDDHIDNHADVTAVLLNRIQPLYDSK